MNGLSGAQIAILVTVLTAGFSIGAALFHLGGKVERTLSEIEDTRKEVHEAKEINVKNRRIMLRQNWRLYRLEVHATTGILPPSTMQLEDSWDELDTGTGGGEAPTPEPWPDQPAETGTL